MDTRIKTDVSEEILTLDDVSNFIKFEDDLDVEKFLINNMIVSVRAHFEKRTGLSFIEKTYETFFRHNDKPYVLPVEPIISVDKVETVDYQGTKAELVLNTGYFKKGLYQVEILTSEMAGWTNPLTSSGGYYDLLVTYKAGYGNDSTEKLPEDLLTAMRMQIKQWYDNRDDFYEFKILGTIEKILNRYKIKLL